MVLVPAKKLFANGVFDLIEISILSRLKMNKKLLIHKKSFLNFCPLFISHQIVGRISMTHNGLAINSTGANQSLLSVTHITKFFCSVFSLFQSKSKRFCALHKNPQTFKLSTKPVFAIAIVVLSLFFLMNLIIIFSF